MASLLQICILFLTVCIVVDGRFYRNIPLPRSPQKLISLEVPSEEPQIIFEPSHKVHNHLLALRPDYALFKLAEVFKSFLDRRFDPSLINKEKADSFLRHQLRNSLQ
ncbi:unnamed protein product [Bursaphelenchus xylophilus]|uniref:(pine wood nematode) hypothetical protein n=1 Tax=Bursaphelenchus xylophilus TaxID=6326 RepID=A0A1I7RPU4_BURXY|nr:unnamed protein product [Bursaphelenchus xylophilus]CAG9096632.1 unnamed protein product [Bursaphelenchus xylophilus]